MQTVFTEILERHSHRFGGQTTFFGRCSFALSVPDSRRELGLEDDTLSSVCKFGGDYIFPKTFSYLELARFRSGGGSRKRYAVPRNPRSYLKNLSFNNFHISALLEISLCPAFLISIKVAFLPAEDNCST